MTENRPRRSWTTNPAEKRNCTGHLLHRPPTQNHPQSARRNATPPDAARRLASHFGRRPRIIGRPRLPIRHPSAGTLVPRNLRAAPETLFGNLLLNRMEAHSKHVPRARTLYWEAKSSRASLMPSRGYTVGKYSHMTPNSSPAPVNSNEFKRDPSTTFPLSYFP